MKPPTSARSAERSSKASGRRQTRNRYNLPMKNQMKNPPVVAVPKVPLVGPRVLVAGQADLLEILADLPVNQAGHPGGLAGLPVDQADHPEGAEDRPLKA